MRKHKKLLSVLLMICMVLTLVPTFAYADSASADVQQETVIGDPDAAYTLTIVNDAAQAVNYTVTYNGKSEDVAVADNGTILLHLNEGDSYSVTVKDSASPYYKVVSTEYTFVSGELTINGTDLPWSHTLGADVKVGQYITYTVGGAPVDEQDVSEMADGTLYLLGTLQTWNASLKSDNRTVLFTGVDGVETYEKAATSAKNLTALNNAIAALESELTGEGYVGVGNVKASSSGLIFKSYSVSGTYSIYQPVVKAVADLTEPCPAGNVTLTFCPTVAEKTGGVSVDTYNVERLNFANKKINISLALGLLGKTDMLSGLMDGNMSLESISALLEDDTVNDLAQLMIFDNMPASTVTLTEIDEGNGFYEGRTYTLPVTKSIPLSIVVNYLLGKQQIDLPIDIGYHFSLDGVRVGKYELSVSTPAGDGWMLDDCSQTFEINVTEGSTVSGIGEQRSYITLIMLTPSLKANGVWFDRVPNAMTFSNVNMKMEALPGSTFTIINRDQLLALTDSLLGMGRSVVDSVVGGLSFDEVADINRQVRSDADVLEADADTTDNLMTSFTTLLGGGMLNGITAPAILEATADANGLVTFTEANNVSIRVLIDLVGKLGDTVGKFNILPSEIDLGSMGKFTMADLKDLMAKLDNNVGYAALRMLGLVGSKFPTGNYIMFQKSAPEGYIRNPAMYTISSSWDGASYSAYTKLGVVGPLVADQFYTFAQKLGSNPKIEAKLAQYANVADHGLAWLRSTMNGKDELSASVIAYAAKVVYCSMGGNRIYNSPEEVADALISMLDNSEYTFTNLLNAVNSLIGQGRNVFAGTVNENWYYYNISADIFSNARDLFDYVLYQLVPAEIADGIENAYGDEMDALGDVVNGKIDEVADTVEEYTQAAEETVGVIVDAAEEIIASGSTASDESNDVSAEGTTVEEGADAEGDTPSPAQSSGNPASNLFNTITTISNSFNTIGKTFKKLF